MTSHHPMRTATRITVTLLLAGTGAALLPGCAPLAVGGAMVGTTMVAIDRRTAAAQLEDETIEIKGSLRGREAGGEAAHISVTSYNRVVLITGEVPTDAVKRAVEQAVSRVENVRSIVNDLGVMPVSSLTARSNDIITTGRVKAAFIDASDLQSSNIKVTTERGVVYLMGRLTEREATRAVGLARGQSGVQKVVRVFEILTDQELAEIQRGGRPK